jgi:hypothetical protein
MKSDQWDVCYADEHKKLATPEQFSQIFCADCMNAICPRSKANTTKWVNRMDTQVELLLRNPRFAPESAFPEIRGMNFEDKVREALAIEVANTRGDWAPVRQEDIAFMAASIVGFVPSTSPDAMSHDVEEFEFPSTSKSGVTYTVVYDPSSKQWSCSCEGFKHHHNCKHISTMQASPPVAKKPTPPPGPRSMPSTEAVSQAMQANHIPKSMNTTPPRGGITVGAPPPVVDPWAPPPPKDDVVPVGGRIVLGGKK